jgi:hypothetical protein
MRDRRRLAAIVDSIVKGSDSEVQVQRAFYDDASDRLFITLVRGLFRVNLTLSANDIEGDDRSKAKRVIDENIAQLDRVPVG